MSATNLATDCTAGERLTSIDAAFAHVAGLGKHVAETETIPVAEAAGRLLAEDVSTATPLPPFDNSAVDGYGVSAGDVDRPTALRLKLTGRLAAGDSRGSLQLKPGEAVRLLTGAAVPPGVCAVALEERCRKNGGFVSIGISVPDAANIRRRGEDVAEGATIVEAPTLLDARHIAILVAAGIRHVSVRRKIRVAVLSNGNELCEPGSSLTPDGIYDGNRPMLLALLSGRWVDAIDAGRHPDDRVVLKRVFSQVAADADVVISSGGAAGSDTDHVGNAIASAGGAVQRFRLALRPGKPILAGTLGHVAVIGLPGNPVAALVNFLLFGQGVVSAVAGLPASRPRGQAALTAGAFAHTAGRTEFVPVRIIGVDDNGRPLVEKLGRGGSARLRPLVMADGLAEIPADRADLPDGAPLAFHSFKAAFAS
jgi:molybdopterin molybdotransferase